ncbi:MAG: hypothetical protein CMC85_03900 [Flavobacteriaceae bacterium]|nr:hypothetical protein [Flavobacteriaceae bacterium]
MKKFKILIVIFFFNLTDLFSQCAMCRAVLESQEDQSVSAGLNDGIIYLMAIPYIVAGVIGFLIYKKFKK